MALGIITSHDLGKVAGRPNVAVKSFHEPSSSHRCE
jgi:hypothetical protein